MLSTVFIISIVLLLFAILRQLILASTHILYLSKDDELAQSNSEAVLIDF